MLATGGGLIFTALMDGTIAAFDDTTLDELWKINVGSGFSAPAMTFEVNGKQYLAIVSGPSNAARTKVLVTPELKDQRNSTVLYVFALVTAMSTRRDASSPPCASGGRGWESALRALLRSHHWRQDPSPSLPASGRGAAGRALHQNNVQ